MKADITSGGRWACEQCGDRFDREKSGARPIRFCTPRCYHDWRAANDITTGQFKAGHATWNKGVKGLHLSPSTEFKPGCESNRRLPLGSVTIRTRRRDKLPRAFVKIAEPNTWKERAIVVWEAANGPVPRGKVIHHKDRNSLNDALDNLEALTRAEHALEHSRDRYAPAAPVQPSMFANPAGEAA